jgi:hypothetical protein
MARRGLMPGSATMTRITTATAAAAALGTALGSALAAGCAHRPWEDPSPSWKRVTSDHFVVHTDGDPDDYEPVVERLEDAHTALSSTFFEGLSVPRVDVLLFERPSDFKGVAPGKDVNGFFAPGLGAGGGGLLVFSSDGDFDVVGSVAAHELAHRFLFALSDRVPAWLHEGFAKYVGGITLLDEMVAFDLGDIHGGYVYFADPVPLDRLFAAGNRDFHSSEGLAHYMTSWIMIRHLFASQGGDAPARFRRLVERVASSPSPAAQAAAVADTFGVPLDEVQREVVAFHRAVYHGMGQSTTRRSVAVTLRRPPRRALAIEPADRAAIKAVCAQLRQARER